MSGPHGVGVPNGDGLTPARPRAGSMARSRHAEPNHHPPRAAKNWPRPDTDQAYGCATGENAGGVVLAAVSRLASCGVAWRQGTHRATEEASTRVPAPRGLPHRRQAAGQDHGRGSTPLQAGSPRRRVITMDAERTIPGARRRQLRWMGCVRLGHGANVGCRVAVVAAGPARWRVGARGDPGPVARAAAARGTA